MKSPDCALGILWMSYDKKMMATGKQVICFLEVFKTW